MIVTNTLSGNGDLTTVTAYGNNGNETTFLVTPDPCPPMEPLRNRHERRRRAALARRKTVSARLRSR